VHNSLEVNEYLVKAKHRLAEHDGVEGLVHPEAAKGGGRVSFSFICTEIDRGRERARERIRAPEAAGSVLPIRRTR